MKRILAIAAALVMVLFGGIMSASAASALTADPCTPTDYTVLNGTTVQFTFSGECTLSDISEYVAGATIDVGGLTGPDGAQVGTLLITINNETDFVYVYTAPYYTQYVTGCGVDPGTEFYPDHVIVCSLPVVEEGPAAPPPPDSIQEVGMPVSGSCAAIDDKGMDLGTGLTGGWKQSWSQWPNEGKGGPVCGRALHYSLALHRWVVA
jgi:hypothetical protein